MNDAAQIVTNDTIEPNLIFTCLNVFEIPSKAKIIITNMPH